MLAELRTKSQITLPKEIVNSLGLSEGDKLDVSERDGVIYLTPVTVYPKKYVDELQTELSELKKNIADERQSLCAFDKELCKQEAVVSLDYRAILWYNHNTNFVEENRNIWIKKEKDTFRVVRYLK